MIKDFLGDESEEMNGKGGVTLRAEARGVAAAVTWLGWVLADMGSLGAKTAALSLGSLTDCVDSAGPPHPHFLSV